MPYLNYYSDVESKVWIRKILRLDATSEEEREFRRYFQRRTLPMAQIAIVIGFLLIAGVCVLDWLLMPPQFALPVIKLRATTILAVLVLVFAFTIRGADEALDGSKAKGRNGATLSMLEQPLRTTNSIQRAVAL